MPSDPTSLWVSDFTYVSTWRGWVYVAFVVDVFSRRIVGWRQSSSMHTEFVLDALEQALYDRKPSDDGHGLIITRTVGRNTCPSATASAWPGWHRALVGLQGRQLRQRPGRDDQRALQGRSDPSARAVEDQAGGGTGNAGMGRLVPTTTG